MWIKDGKIFRTEKEIRSFFKGISLPPKISKEVLLGLEVREVLESVKPVPSEGQVLNFKGISEDPLGTYREVWELIEVPNE